MRVGPIIALLLLAAATAPPIGAVAQAQAPIAHAPYHGPKKTLAVSKFDAVGGFVAEYGGWDIGGGLAAMLASELSRTNRFIVVDRADLDTLLREKQMALSDVTTGTSGRPLLGAQTFIRGSVTEFEQSEKGGGLSIGLNLPGGKGGLGSRNASGHVAIDLRLIDAESGAILASRRVEKKVKSSSVALQGNASGFAFGGDQFNKTSLGRAAREAIQEAVSQIVRDMENVPWQGLVARSEGDRVYVNAGRNANLAPGMRLRASRTVNAITDPASGESLGSEKVSVGDIVIVDVHDRYSMGRRVGGILPATGDVVEMISNR